MLVCESIQDIQDQLFGLCDRVPLERDDDDLLRTQEVNEVRTRVASMWARALHIARQYGKDDERAKVYLHDCESAIVKLAREHGQILAFAPSPDPEFLFPSNPEVVLVASPNSSASSPATSPGTMFVEHDFKFLQVENDVWTVLQVGMGMLQQIR